MRGRERACKKHIKQAGWSIARESQGLEGRYELELQGPRGERMKVDAPSRPLVWRRAERAVLGTGPGLALWARA